MGHIARSTDISLNIDNKIWFTNISHIASMLNVQNVKNATILWEDTKDENQVVEEGIRETLNILDRIKLNPEVTTISLWSLMFISGTTFFLIIILLVFVCVPGSLMSFKRCCCRCNRADILEKRVRPEDY